MYSQSSNLMEASSSSDESSYTSSHKWFDSIDIFGLNFLFQAKRRETFRTKCGAVFTIIYIFITIGLFMGFGMDLYQRKRPRVSNNNKIVPYEETIIDNKNFTLAFRVEDRYGKEVINSSIVNLELTYFLYVMNSQGEWENTFEGLYPFVRCASLKDIKEKERFFNHSLQSWHCIDFEDFKMGGNWDGNFVYGLLINTKQCSAEKHQGKDKDNITCLSETDLKTEFQHPLTGANYFYSYMYLEALPEMDDYDQPVKTHLVNKYEQLSLKATKRTVQTYKKVTVENDGGWFFSELEKLEFFSSDSILTDFSFKEEFSQDIVYTHLIYFGNKVDFYTRSYMKIQEVIANIGGFAKIFYTFMSYIYMYIGLYLKNKYLMSRVDFAVRDHVPLPQIVNIKLYKIQDFEDNHVSYNNKNISDLDKFPEHHHKSLNDADKMIDRVRNSNMSSSVKTFLKHFPNKNLNLNKFSHKNNEGMIDNITLKSQNIENTSLTGNHNNIIRNNNDNDIKLTNNIAVGGINRFINKTHLNLIDIPKSNHNNSINLHSNNIISRKNKQLRRKKSENTANSILQKHYLFDNNNSNNNKNEYLNNQKVNNDSSNLEYLNLEEKDLNKLNMIKDKDNARSSKKEHVSTACKILLKSVNLLQEKNVSIFRLMCIDAFRMRKKSTPKKLGFYYFYFNKFIEFYDKKFDVFNFLRICEEFENLKDIVFEDYKFEFAKMRPVIDLDECGMNCERSSNKKYDLNTINMKKLDRILTNLLCKLEKKQFKDFYFQAHNFK